jgi:hypothetical protein
MEVLAKRKLTFDNAEKFRKHSISLKELRNIFESTKIFAKN